MLRPPRAIAGVLLALPGGALIAVFGFLLDEKAYELGGGGAAVGGFLAGAAIVFAVERALAKAGAQRERFGSLIDTAPMAMLVALTLVEDGDIGGAVLATVFGANVALATAAGAEARSWSVAVLGSTLASALTYAVLQSASDTAVALIQAAAIGAVVSMAVGRMLAGAIERRPQAIGLWPALGFGAGFGVSIA